MASTARFDLKLDQADKDLFSQASALMGTSMAGFVRAAAKEKAQYLIEQETRLALSQRDIGALGAAIEHAFAPNQALSEAIDAARHRVRRA